MKISTRGRYALRLMTYLAKQEENKVISLKDISKEEDISLKYLEQIVSALSKQKLILSIRGAKGGYRLLKPANEYRVGDILKTVEGSICPVSCLEANETCSRKEQCSTIKLWQGLDKVINEYLNAYTLDDLIKNETFIV